MECRHSPGRVGAGEYRRLGRTDRNSRLEVARSAGVPVVSQPAERQGLQVQPGQMGHVVEPLGAHRRPGRSRD